MKIRELPFEGHYEENRTTTSEILQIAAPEMVFDLPAGGRRLVQRASGYEYTICNGEVIVDHGVPTEARPGGLVRGPQPDPASST